MNIAAARADSDSASTLSGTDSSHVPPQIPDHTLLRRIGRGSYGEVWLARNVIGAYRAVKIVDRRNFEDPRPFDREFHGIQKFEPISRSHDGLVDVLQVGRDDAEKYFYYIMELADDLVSGGEIVAEKYEPKTLRRQVSKGGALSPSECVTLGLTLTTALGNLHEHGLVHRDIKPSNIIFVNGIPKLADIGLVTGVDATRSYVGTEGFVPPEGSGTPQADLYSLGKVLYEISTGKDRQEFPDLPTAMRASLEGEELLELNEVLIKACATEPRKRYQTADELHADLALLRSGKSVRHLRVVELRLAQARMAGLVAGIVALVATVAGLLFAHQIRVERDSRQRIQKALDRAEAAEHVAEAAKQVANQESYARAMLLAHESVQANNFGLVRDLLEQTRAFAVDGGTTNAIRHVPAWEWRHLQYECRDEAAAVLARCAQSVDSVAVSPDGQWFAAGDGAGRVLLWNLSDSQSPQEWPVVPAGVECLVFSPDSRWLAAGCIDGWVRILRIPSGELVAEFREGGRILDLRFSTTGRTLVHCSMFGLGSHDLTTLAHSPTRGNFVAWRAAIGQDLLAASISERLVLYQDNPRTNFTFQNVIGNSFHDHSQAISPDGRWLATALADHSIELWSLSERKAVRRLVGHTAAVQAVAWSADSRLLASGGFDQMVNLWDVERGTSLRRLRGHHDHITSVALSPDGRTLYSGSQDRTVRAWTLLQAAADPDAIALPAQSAYACLGPGARFAWGVSASETAFWAIKTERAPKPHGRLRSRHAHLAISPDGQWLVAALKVCVLFRYESNEYTPSSTQEITVTTETRPVFSPDGSRLAVVGTNGVLTLWQLEPWRELARWQGVEGQANTLMFDPTGKRIFVCCPSFGVFAADTITDRLSRMSKGSKSEISGMDISPDNRFMAVSCYDGTVALWACAPGEEPRSLGTIVPERTDVWSVAFSPDGLRLAVGLADGNIHIWDIKHRTMVGVLKGHRQPVWKLGFNSEDDSLVSVSPDELRVWRVADGN